MSESISPINFRPRQISVAEPNNHPNCKTVFFRKKIEALFHAFLEMIRGLFLKTPKEKSVALYAFTQQYNDTCHLSPIVNLKLLNKMSSSNYNINTLSHLSRRQWHGEDQRMLTAWHGLMSKLSQKNAEREYPELIKFLRMGIERGPVSPNFYSQNGRPYFQGVRGFLEFSDMPFFLIDLESLKKTNFHSGCISLNFDKMLEDIKLGIITGIVKDNGIYKIYNSKTKEYESIDGKTWISIVESDGRKLVIFKEELLTPEIRLTYQLSKEGIPTLEMTSTKNLGFQEVAINEELWSGIRTVDSTGKKHTYFPFESSLLKLMLLTVGVDENNDPIDEGHELYALHSELRSLMSQDPENPWHPANLQKDMLFQYHLAEIFKEDPKLFAMAKQAICQYNPKIMENYHKLKDGFLSDHRGRPLSPEVMEKFLLGEEQMVAYYFSANLRYTWYSAISPKAMQKSYEIGLSPCFAPLTHRYMKYHFLKKFSFQFNTEKSERLSYLDVWTKIREKVVKRNKITGRKNYVSFDDHGWVISFDPTIKEWQNKFTSKIYDTALLKRLNFAGVESWLSSELGLWYTRASKH